MVNTSQIVSAGELLAKIRVEVAAKRLKPIDLAREADLQPSTVYSMLEPDWTNRAIDNLEALSAAFARLTNPTQATPASQAPAQA